jgi:uncharacterized membrane protein
MDIFGAFRAVFGFALALFIPGYAFILLLYPKKKDLGTIERVALASVMSMAITLLMALFLDMVLGIDFTGENISIALIVFTVLCLMAWLMQTKGKY